MKAAEIREAFLKYFEKNKHKRLSSSSLVPSNDPTLFFTNAGMVQFKDTFLGVEKRDYNRATTSQKCMRVSGKHNDLENVGRTPRHHTFFEMLGNFSFGDYFKREAIAYAWEFLTKVVGLSKNQLYITIYKDDDEAGKLWKKHVDKSRIFRLGEKDNFWAMADVGPCGPCSEIIFDRKPGGDVKAEDLEDDRFLEVWNLVFMQFNRRPDGTTEKLAKPSIDTGMGLERLAAVMEGVYGNYETDLFMPVIRDIEKISDKKYGAGYSPAANDDASMRVIADHIRAMTFLVGDGVQPSNEGRGYVLRRIIRRALRHGKLLQIEKPFFKELAHTVIDLMGGSYPELIQHKDFIEKVVVNEETRFNETLDNGLEILGKKFDELKKNGEKVLPGEDVFRLYDTYGFPKDLTEDIAADAGLSIDNDGFEKSMNEQRQRARSAWKGSGEQAVDAVYKGVSADGVVSKFVGYDNFSSDATVLAIVKDGKRCKSANAGEKIDLVVDCTPFYGESGGQVGDTGMLVADDLEIEISNAMKPLPNLIVHRSLVKKGAVKKGDKVTLAIDVERRKAICKNHTATHILHRALRETLGEHVKQSGSLVRPDRLRFDFSHFSAVTDKQLKEIEADANRIIRENIPVNVENLKYDEAISRGALAFFGDKYGDEVRTITIGNYSTELCGGAHVAMSGDIGMVKIVSESSVAAGIRRIEAVTGRGVEEYFGKIETGLASAAERLKCSKDDIVEKVDKLIFENKRLQKEIEKLRSELYSGKSAGVGSEIETVGDVNVIAKLIDGVCAKELRTLSDNLKSKVGSGIVMLAAESDGKTSLIVVVTKDLTGRFKAGDIVRQLVAPIGGTGGGRADMAQGGAGVVGKFDELKERLREIVG